MRDLRIPIGGFFVLVGAIVGVTGLTTDYRAPLGSANIDLYSGAAMLVFGAVMLWLGRRKPGGHAS
jgi:hypothetical protein